MPSFIDVLVNSGRTNLRNSGLNRGDLISFNYILHSPGHDAYPLVLVTDPNFSQSKYGSRTSFAQQYVRGINLHYLTFPVIKKLIFPNDKQSVCENTNLTYQSIKDDGYISTAFRQYKKSGMSLVKKLDCKFIVNAMSFSRSFDPNEIEAVRNSVRDQINRLVNPPARSTENE